jgi:hypothetical protein
MIEALVAAGLAGIALAGLVATAALATDALRLARDVATALALGSERLEALRGGPRADGADRTIAPDGTAFERRWQTDGGRGLPLRLSTELDWGRRPLELRTEVWP